jgi:hypothetical protein
MKIKNNNHIGLNRNYYNRYNLNNFNNYTGKFESFKEILPFDQILINNQQIPGKINNIYSPNSVYSSDSYNSAINDNFKKYRKSVDNLQNISEIESKLSIDYILQNQDISIENINYMQNSDIVSPHKLEIHNYQDLENNTPNSISKIENL